jgi:hypothetical protein
MDFASVTTSTRCQPVVEHLQNNLSFLHDQNFFSTNTITDIPSKTVTLHSSNAHSVQIKYNCQFYFQFTHHLQHQRLYTLRHLLPMSYQQGCLRSTRSRSTSQTRISLALAQRQPLLKSIRDKLRMTCAL